MFHLYIIVFIFKIRYLYESYSYWYSKQRFQGKSNRQIAKSLQIRKYVAQRLLWKHLSDHLRSLCSPYKLSSEINAIVFFCHIRESRNRYCFALDQKMLFIITMVIVPWEIYTTTMTISEDMATSTDWLSLAWQKLWPAFRRDYCLYLWQGDFVL